VRVGKNIGNAWSANNARTRKLGLPSTLTAEQWRRTLDLFEGKCAYCEFPAQCLDHYIPIRFGGGTTWANCVPSCLGCNSSKANSVGLNSRIEESNRVIAFMKFLDLLEDTDRCHYGPTLATSWCFENQDTFQFVTYYKYTVGFEYVFRRRLSDAARRFGFYNKKRGSNDLRRIHPGGTCRDTRADA